MYCNDIEIPVPYKGLIPYSQTDKLFFFGREKEQQIVIQNLWASRLTVVYGASGVGKSSLMRAGVAYNLRQSALENQETTGKPGWGAIVFPPLKGELDDSLSWQDPLTGIKKQLEAEITNLFKTESPDEIKRQFEQALKAIAKNPEQPSFTDILKAWIEIVHQEDESGRLFIILDQFEDYFDFLNDSVQDIFADEFSQAVNNSSLNLHFLISIREDALSKLDHFKGRIFRNLLDNRIAIKHLNRQSAQDAIEKPIAEYNRQQTILNNLCKSKLTLLYGDSSAGKSTILRDGIAYYLHQAAEQNLQKSGQLKLAVTLFNSWYEGKPLDNILLQIKQYLKNIGNIEVPHLDLSFTETLQAWIKLIDIDESGKLFILLDQFEEYLTHSPKDETKLFLDELFRAVNHPNININLLLCLHKNTLQKLEFFKEDIVQLCPYYLHISSNLVKKQPIVDNFIKSTIVQPIEDKLISIEPDLVTAVLDDIALSQAPSEQRFETPYLQLVMLRLWKQEMRRESPSRSLEKQSYINLGKAEQIVQDHLDQKLEDLKTDFKIEISDSLFYYLVTPSGDKLALKARDLCDYVNAESNRTEKLELEKIEKWLNKLSEGHARIIRPLAANRYEIFLDVLAKAIWKRLQRQRKIKEIEQMAQDALLQFESSELEALLTAMRAGQEFQNNRQKGLLPRNCYAPQLKTALQHILDNIQEQNQFQLGGGQVFGVSFNPKVQKLVNASLDFSVYLWDLQGKSMVKFKGHKGWVWGASLSPDGQYLATASADCTACLWNLQGKPLVEFKGHKGSVLSVSFSSDGKHFATASLDSTARLWDLQGKLLVEFAGHQDWVLSVCFSPDGKYLATASTDGTARLWDLQGNPLTIFSVVDVGSVSSVSFSPDGQYLATASADGTARLWDLQGNLLTVFKDHQGWVWSVSFSPDGQRFATVSWDGTTRLWDLQGNQLALLKGHKSLVGSVSFSPDGQYLATGFWDGSARIWNLQNKPLVEFKGHQRWILSISFSPDGQYVATGSSDGTACLWDLKGKPLTVFKGGKYEILSISFSPDGQYLATGSSDGNACLWDLDGKPLTVFKRHNNWVWSISFSPDGQYLATSSTDGTARLWNLQGEQLVEFKSNQGLVWSVNFSPDGQYIATGSSDGTACLWDIKGNPLVIFKGHQSWIWNVSFSPDGKYLATTSCDTTARLWDLQGNPLIIFKGHQSWIWNASFSPDGQRIATASSDGTARLWDLQGNQLAVFKGHTGVYDISFSPDGQQLAIALADGTAKLWRIEDIDQLLAKGCNWLKDYFVTHPEVREYLTVCQT
ncbi:WD-repeat protein [Nostoc sp. NIES-4103]|nr:WD-repeat protein [Nostoc sp. NIES-4103]